MTKSDIQMVQSHFSKIQKDSDCELTQAKEFMECHFGLVQAICKDRFFVSLRGVNPDRST